MSLELRQRIAGRRRVYLLRHGEVSYFDGAGKPYPAEGVPLNGDGKLQAEAARSLFQDVPLDLAVHSGLRRTRETAGIIVGGRQLPIVSCEALREVAPGPFAGDPSRPVHSSFEEYFVGALGTNITRESRFLGGETFGSLEDRALPAFKALLLEPNWKHLLIVAHGGTNRVILLHALGASLSQLGKIEQEAGCINIIDLNPEPVGPAGQGAPPVHWIVRLVNYSPSSPLKENIWSTTMEKIFLDHYEAVESNLKSREKC